MEIINPDNYIAGFFARPIAQILAKTKITPNQVTLINFFISIIPAAFFFSRGTYIANLIALYFCWQGAVLDIVDGEVARLKSMLFQVGEWLDTNLDVAAQNLIILAIGYGVFISKGNMFYLFFALFALFGNALLNNISSLYITTFGFSRKKRLTHIF